MIRTARIAPRFLAGLLATSALAPAAAFGQALPQGGSVVSGQVDIGAPAQGQMTIRQGSDRAIVNWNSFSIGKDGRVSIEQPDARSALLNRVAGPTTSEIAGTLSANGQVYLVNSNGILIQPGGSINVDLCADRLKNGARSTALDNHLLKQVQVDAELPREAENICRILEIGHRQGVVEKLRELAGTEWAHMGDLPGKALEHGTKPLGHRLIAANHRRERPRKRARAPAADGRV